MRGLGIVAMALGIAACDRVFDLDLRDAPPPDAARPPWLDGYTYRKQITITPPAAQQPLIDYPVSLVVTDPQLGAHARADGGDLAITTADNQRLAYELVAFDPSAGSLEAWVKLPILAPATTELWLYYGGSPAPPSQEPPPIWAADIEAVWHFSEAGLAVDSTVDKRELTGSSTIERVPGIAGGGRSFDDTEALTGDDPPDGSLDFGMSSFSYSAWVRVTASVGLYDMPLFKGGTSATVPGYSFLLGMNEWQLSIGDGTTDLGVSLGNDTDLVGDWVQVVAVIDRSLPQVRTYTNGELVEAVPLTLGSVDSVYALVVGGPTNYPFSGTLDEIRIYRRALSAEWIRAEYANLARRDSFIAITDEEQR